VRSGLEHPLRGRGVRGLQRIDRLQYPHRFRERKVRNPRARRDERLGGGNRGRTCVSNGRLRYSDRLIASYAACRARAAPVRIRSAALLCDVLHFVRVVAA
jgi:hypothetical protein